MKKLILIFATLLSLSTFSEVIAKREFGVRGVDFKNGLLYKVSLHDDRTIEIQTCELIGGHRYSMPQCDRGVVFSKTLKRRTFQNLESKVRVLSNAEIKRYHAHAICMMLPDPIVMHDGLTVLRDYDVRGRTYHGDLEQIMGPQGCWVSYKVAPKDQEMRELAEDLSDMLEALAVEFVDGE